jgi:hypothetical protein
MTLVPMTMTDLGPVVCELECDDTHLPLVDAYNTVSIDAAELFDKLKAFVRDLGQEEARGGCEWVWHEKAETTWQFVLARYGLAGGLGGSIGQIHGP